MQDIDEPSMAQQESHSAPVLNSNSSSKSSGKTLAQVWLDGAATAPPGQQFSVCTHSVSALPGTVSFSHASCRLCIIAVVYAGRYHRQYMCIP